MDFEDIIRRVDPGYVIPSSRRFPELARVEEPEALPNPLPVAPQPVLRKAMADRSIGELADLARRDPAFIEGIRQLIAESGLMEVLGLSYDAPLDAYSPFPANWTAIEIGLFDNGPPAPRKRNRDKVRTQTTRFKLRIKVMTKMRITKLGKDITWDATVPLWTSEEAAPILEQLLTQRLVDDRSVEALAHMRALLPDALVGVPRAFGQRYARGHAVGLAMSGDHPEQMVFWSPDGSFAVGEFSDRLAGGAPVKGIVAQARLARVGLFESWALEFAD